MCLCIEFYLIRIKDLNKGIKTSRWFTSNSEFTSPIRIKDLNKGIKTFYFVPVIGFLFPVLE